MTLNYQVGIPDQATPWTFTGVLLLGIPRSKGVRVWVMGNSIASDEQNPQAPEAAASMSLFPAPLQELELGRAKDTHHWPPCLTSSQG
jgi:hypothetical protein